MSRKEGNNSEKLDGIFLLKYHLVRREEVRKREYIKKKRSCSWSVLRNHVILYYIISWHIISCHIISYHITSYDITSYHTIPYHIISHHIMSWSYVLTLAVHVRLSWEIMTALGGPVVPKQHTHTAHSIAHTQMHTNRNVC